MHNCFQSDDCFDFYSNLFFLEPFKYMVLRGDEVKGIIVGFIQRDGGKLQQFFSRRAIINGGPMLTDDISETELSELLSKCKRELKHKVIYIESRNFDDYSNYREVFEKSGYQYEPHYNFMINTSSSLENIWNSFSKNHKRSIKSALIKGVVINNEPSPNQISDFYKILNNLYSTRVKTPLFPEVFFHKLNEYGKVITIQSPDSKVIGGIAMASFVGNTCYEWFVCGDDSKYKSLHPSTIATYAGIKYAVENGYKRFDFMGAGAPGDGGYGVRDFKAKFGGELVEYGRFKCILNPILYRIGTFGIKMLKKLK